MPGKTDLRRLFAGLLLAAALSGPASAYVFINNPSTNIPVKWDTATVPIRIMLGDSLTLQDGLNYNTSAQAAAQAWNNQMGAVQFTVSFATGNAAERNGFNELWFSSTIFGEAFEGTTIAVTSSFRSGNTRTSSDITFRSDRTWNSYRGPTQSGVLDLQRVALHELGHMLGLTHPDENGQTISPTPIMNSRVGGTDALTADDIEGVQRLYGPPGIPTNNNFSSATVVTLGSNNTAALVGYNTNATKEAGEPNHASNAGGSSVWWRWTAPSTASVTIDTRGSVFDTTIGVYTGTSVSALTQVAGNDDIQSGVVQASEVTFNATAGTTYQIAVDGFDNDRGGISLNVSFQGTNIASPTISVQPSSQTVSAGNAANFIVVANGPGTLVYQWFFNGNAIAGATGSNHSVANAQVANAGNYHVVVSNAGGSVTSSTVTLTVNAVPPPPASGGGGGGGGGGAPSLWFALALLLVGGLRAFLNRRA